MHFIFAFVTTLALNPRAQARPVLHTMTCAGFLDGSTRARAADALDPRGTQSGLYRIAGRLRRVTIQTATWYAAEAQPDRRLEVPVVDARRPGWFARALPALRFALDSEPVRAFKILFNDRVLPRVTETVRNGIPRFTYGLASGADVTPKQLRTLATHLYARGFGRRATFPPRARAFEVVLGRRVYSGAEFYELVHAVNTGAGPAPRGMARVVRYLAHLNLAQLIRNARVPYAEKTGYRPRFVYDGDDFGDLTAARLTEIAIDLEDRTELAPEGYDVVVAGRAFSGVDFAELHRRMLAHDVVSVDAERGLAEAGRVGRSSVLMDNVAWALGRHDANEIVVVARNGREVERLTADFDARFGVNTYRDDDAWPLLDASAADLVDTNLVYLVDHTFSQKHFANAEEFLNYFDPRRVEGVGDDTFELAEVAVVAHAFFRTLRARLPEFNRLAPTPEQRGRLRRVTDAFGPYAFAPFADADDSRPFSFATVRWSFGPVGADLRPNDVPLD